MDDRTTPRRHGARDLARRAVQEQVSALAYELFLDRGYEGTTVEGICSAAGISRSTFFRYFSSKDDALLGDTVDAGTLLADALRARPAEEPPWAALRRALEPLIDHYVREPERALRLARLVASTPSLAAWHHEKNAGWHELLRPEVARRLGVDPSDLSDPRPAALIASALGCADAAVAAWVASGEGEGEGEALGAMLDRAMAAPLATG